MVAIASSVQVFSGYQGPAAAAVAQKPAQTADAGNVSDNDRAGLLQIFEAVAAQASKRVVFPAIASLLFSWEKIDIC